MKGVNFITDEKDKPIAVQIDLKKHKSLWEDFYSLMIAEVRRKETSRSYVEIRKELNIEHKK
ncbi:MAG: hypothetical protein ABIO44_01645 [Saprospiraceae bacterium]